jgi:hypothetical protein
MKVPLTSNGSRDRESWSEMSVTTYPSGYAPLRVSVFSGDTL